jgi:hypothetical protein
MTHHLAPYHDLAIVTLAFLAIFALVCLAFPEEKR